jgi:hypothetical protein
MVTGPASPGAESVAQCANVGTQQDVGVIQEEKVEDPRHSEDDEELHNTQGGFSPLRNELVLEKSSEEMLGELDEIRLVVMKGPAKGVEPGHRRPNG